MTSTDEHVDFVNLSSGHVLDARAHQSASSLFFRWLLCCVALVTMPNFVEGDYWSGKELARAAALFRDSPESLQGIFKLQPKEARRARWHKSCDSSPCISTLMMPCMAPCVCWLCRTHKAIMDETLVVVTDRTLYRDVNGQAKVMQNQARVAAKLDGTLCEGLSEPPTGGYSGRLPLDRVMTITSSAEPHKVVRLDGEKKDKE